MPSDLALSSLAAGYGKRTVLTEVSVTFPEGSRTLVIGANGSGKSTLLKAIFRLLPQTSGELTLGDEDLLPLGPRDLVQRGVTFMPQGGRLFEELTVAENLQLANSANGDETLGVFLEQHFPEVLASRSRLARTLSGGERQAIALALALARVPRLLLLDEPTHALATTAVEAMLQRIDGLYHELKPTLIIVEHRVLDALQVADRVLALRRGKVYGLRSVLEVDDEWLSEVFLG